MWHPQCLFLLSIFAVYNCLLRCSQVNKPIWTDYYLMRSCVISDKPVIAKMSADSLSSCKMYAAKQRGLAFSYRQLDSSETTLNCFVHGCPELNVTAMKGNGSLFSYYSKYARILPPDNITCVPREGIFLVGEERLNYTNAMKKCERFGGSLADILTEERTNRISNLILKSENSSRVKQFYVGLNDIEQHGRFVNMKKEPLNCVPYRAWAPGEPNRLPGRHCVTVDWSHYWRLRFCNNSLNFVCDIMPSGPLNLTEIYCADVESASKVECINYYADAEVEEIDDCRAEDSSNSSDLNRYFDLDYQNESSEYYLYDDTE